MFLMCFTSGRQDTSQIMIMVPLWELQKQKRGWVLEIFMKERTGRFYKAKEQGRDGYYIAE